ncbi:hypothetical protein CXH12_02490 [Citrobacter portucalensis]|uniref:hypothetical protein n=1 Tax=Citrobacter portucalensis TaxID=1639133 RepID=UPI000C9FAF99|nr:hypothetical protein [Citrobacter portucalensis]PKQ51332.1 hypothetical protein CXH12_02490 [Citrobacter portucalensis]
MKFIILLQYAIPSIIIFVLNKYVTSIDNSTSQLVYPIVVLLSIYISSKLTESETNEKIENEKKGIKSIYLELLSKQNKRHSMELSIVKEQISSEISSIIQAETIKKVSSVESELTLEKNKAFGVTQRNEELQEEIESLILENDYYQNEKIKHNDSSQRLLDLIRGFHHNLEQILKKSNIESGELEKINRLSIVLHNNIDEFNSSIQDMVRQEQLRNVNKRQQKQGAYSFTSPLVKENNLRC